MDPQQTRGPGFLGPNLPSVALAEPGSAPAARLDVLPFSKRPPPQPDAYAQAPHSQSYAPQYAPQHLPPPAPDPVFARQPNPTPYSLSQSQPFPQQYGQQLYAPPPPHSLAPVAMGYDRSHTGSVSATSTQRAQTVVIRQRPSLKWGVMIALSGALLGGVLGLGMDANRQEARVAAAAAQARAVTPVAASPMVQPAQPAALVAPVVAEAPVVVPPVVVAPIAPIAPIATPARRGPRAVAGKRPSSVAAKVPAPKAPAPTKVDKGPKTAPTSPGAQPPSDARKILEDAAKDTLNTL